MAIHQCDQQCRQKEEEQKGQQHEIPLGQRPVEIHGARVLNGHCVSEYIPLTVSLSVALSSETSGTHGCPRAQSGKGNLLTTTMSRTGEAARKAQIHTVRMTFMARSSVEKSLIRRGKLQKGNQNNDLIHDNLAILANPWAVQISQSREKEEPSPSHGF